MLKLGRNDLDGYVAAAGEICAGSELDKALLSLDAAQQC